MLSFLVTVQNPEEFIFQCWKASADTQRGPPGEYLSGGQGKPRVPFGRLEVQTVSTDVLWQMITWLIVSSTLQKQTREREGLCYPPYTFMLANRTHCQMFVYFSGKSEGSLTWRGKSKFPP